MVNVSWPAACLPAAVLSGLLTMLGGRILSRSLIPGCMGAGGGAAAADLAPIRRSCCVTCGKLSP